MHLERWSRGRRIGLIGGTVLLGLMVLVAVFSLGVYVGRRGWGSEPSTARPMAQPPLGQQQPADQPVFQPPGQQPILEGQQPWPQERPALSGVLRSIGPNGLTVDTPQGARFVRVTEETRFTRLTDQGEEEVMLEDVRRGRPVDIFGRPTPDGRVLVAERVVLILSQR